MAAVFAETADHLACDRIAAVPVMGIALELAGERRAVVYASVICSGPQAAFPVLQERIDESAGKAICSFRMEDMGLSLDTIDEEAFVRAYRKLSWSIFHKRMDMVDSSNGRQVPGDMSCNAVDLVKSVGPCAEPESLLAVFKQHQTAVRKLSAVVHKDILLKGIGSLVQPRKDRRSPVGQSPYLIGIIHIDSGNIVSTIRKSELFQSSCPDTVTAYAMASGRDPYVAVLVLAKTVDLLCKRSYARYFLTEELDLFFIIEIPEETLISTQPYEVLVFKHAQQGDSRPFFRERNGLEIMTVITVEMLVRSDPYESETVLHQRADMIGRQSLLDRYMPEFR